MKHSHTPRKRFGQNFLIDDGIIYALLAEINPQPKQHILEIGPGLGALTRGLIASGANIDAVEIDRDLASELEATFIQYKNFHLHCADILKFPINTLVKKDKLRVVGNLPYNISTPLLFKLFAAINSITDMFFMLQKEVAVRLTATPNTKEYGRLSIMAQYYCAIYIVIDVPPEAFDPPPKVESCIVQFVPHAQSSLPKVDHDLLHNVVAAAFNQRRKTIANSLKKYVTQQELQDLHIDPILRAENLHLEHYVQITNYLEHR